MNIALVLVIFTSTIFHKSLCHHSGAPTSQCGSMTPRHGVDSQLGASSPYSIKVEKSYYMPGENVSVSIESSGDDIKGYLIQARQIGVDSATGMFAAIPLNGKYLNCGDAKGAVTHKIRLSVKTVNFEWEPPSSLSGNISFFATVVKNKATFWVKLESPELYKREIPSQTTQSTQTSVITVHTSVSTNPQPPTTSQLDASSRTMEPKTSMSTPTSMANSTSASVISSTPITNNNCKPNDPKCDGAQLNHNIVFIFFIGLLLAFWQNAV